MQKWIVLYLVFSVLAFALPTGYAIAVFKFGGLIAHYHDHRQDGPKSNFLSYLADHYLEEKHHDADHRDHENLPFHDHHGESVNFASQTPYTPPVLPSSLAAPKLIIQCDLVMTDITHCPTSSYLDDIWQPPKA